MKTYQNTIYLEVVCTNLYQLVGSQCSRREVKQLCWDFMPQQRWHTDRPVHNPPQPASAAASSRTSTRWPLLLHLKIRPFGCGTKPRDLVDHRTQACTTSLAPPWLTLPFRGYRMVPGRLECQIMKVPTCNAHTWIPDMKCNNLFFPCSCKMQVLGGRSFRGGLSLLVWWQWIVLLAQAAFTGGLGLNLCNVAIIWAAITTACPKPDREEGSCTYHKTYRQFVPGK